MVALFNLIVAERHDDLPLPGNHGNQCVLADVEILQRNADVGIRRARNKFQRLYASIH